MRGGRYGLLVCMAGHQGLLVVWDSTLQSVGSGGSSEATDFLWMLTIIVEESGIGRAGTILPPSSLYCTNQHGSSYSSCGENLFGLEVLQSPIAVDVSLLERC